MQELSTEEYFAAFKSLFNHPSWAHFMATMEGEVSVLNDISSIKTVEDLFYRKGQLRILENLLSLETTVLNAEASHSENIGEVVH